jgi:hypothetical protein
MHRLIKEALCELQLVFYFILILVDRTEQKCMGDIALLQEWREHCWDDMWDESYTFKACFSKKTIGMGTENFSPKRAVTSEKSHWPAILDKGVVSKRDEKDRPTWLFLKQHEKCKCKRSSVIIYNLQLVKQTLVWKHWRLQQKFVTSKRSRSLFTW